MEIDCSFVRDFNQKESMLRNCLDRFINRHLSSFEFMKTKATKHLKQNPKNSQNIMIQFNDEFRKKMQTLENAMLPKYDLHELNKKIAVHCNDNLSQDNKMDLKKKFDEICSYKNKSEESANYYNQREFCLYVASKTFKKTMNEVFSFFFYAAPLKILEKRKKKWKTNGVKISSIGGGPGNDALGAYLGLRSTGLLEDNPTVALEILDLNYKGWSSAVEKPIKHFLSKTVSLNYDLIDHRDTYTKDNLNSDIITACWTLNESLGFKEKFWTELIKTNPNSVYLVVEGDRCNVDKLVEIFKTFNFGGIYYEQEASPRRLMVWKNDN